MITIASRSVPIQDSTFTRWWRNEGKTWASSLLGHLLVLIMIALFAGTIQVANTVLESPELEVFNEEDAPSPTFKPLEWEETPIERAELSPEDLLKATPFAPVEIEGQDFTADPMGGGRGPGNSTIVPFGFEKVGEGNPGTKDSDPGTVDPKETDVPNGLKGRNQKIGIHVGDGSTKGSERAVASGLNWLARHQNANGSWSINGYDSRCKDKTCAHGKAAVGNVDSDTGGTALSLLAFLGSGVTHQKKSDYQSNVDAGLRYLLVKQRADGALFDNTPGGPRMYVHGIATIVLCEAYGMSRDVRLKKPAQAAINFIAKSQNEDGGWRYNVAGEKAADESDLSVSGWQLMALKSAEMSGFKVDSKTLTQAAAFLDSSAKGEQKGLFSYTPSSGPSPTLTAVGLLCRQYIGMKRSDPAMIEGTQYLMQQLPGKTPRNCYYLYYSTQVMHNFHGKSWEEWNRGMRKGLIETQVKEGCATGSWSPDEPTSDPWGESGGRLMITSINTLCLEVYYRYLPLYQLDAEGNEKE